jgi:Aromatic-ring-opening dioxygenase LigAB, LigA subunit
VALGGIGVSIYDVNLVGRRVLHDEAFRKRLQTDPESALAELDLTEQERDALLAGDVGRLYHLGAHEYLLLNVARYRALGLDPKVFSERIRAAGPREA